MYGHDSHSSRKATVMGALCRSSGPFRMVLYEALTGADMAQRVRQLLLRWKEEGAATESSEHGDSCYGAFCVLAEFDYDVDRSAQSGVRWCPVSLASIVFLQGNAPTAANSPRMYVAARGDVELTTDEAVRRMHDVLRRTGAQGEKNAMKLLTAVGFDPDRAVDHVQQVAFANECTATEALVMIQATCEFDDLCVLEL